MVVGLGNPGEQYRHTRHNIGFDVVTAYAAGHDFRVNKKFRASIAQIPGTDSVLAVQPLTFMNRSGEAVGPLASYYRIEPDHVIVVHDDLDLPLGVLRLKQGGGDGGHNGLKSLRAHLGADTKRVRCGIGRPPGRQDPAAYVLRRFPASEQTDVDVCIHRAVDAIDVIIHDGLPAAQNLFNG